MTQATKHTTSEQAVGNGARVYALQLADGGTAGSVELKDGGSGGTVLVSLDTAGSSTNDHVDIPGGGIVFDSSVYVALSNVTSVTLFYEDA